MHCLFSLFPNAVRRTTVQLSIIMRSAASILLPSGGGGGGGGGGQFQQGMCVSLPTAIDLIRLGTLTLVGGEATSYMEQLGDVIST